MYEKASTWLPHTNKANGPQFDERNVSALPELNNVGIENGLFWSAWSISRKNTGIDGIAAHSFPKIAVTTTLTTQILNGTPTITVDYSGSKAIFFNFYSFWFGCVAPLAQSMGGAAVQCSISVAGFDANNKERAVASYTFTPKLGQELNAPMVQAVLPNTFVGLHNMTITQSNPTLQVLGIDDAKYSVYYTSRLRRWLRWN
ncbi:MAG: hypothetical protein Q9212_006232 [Teloschistes hypoglaucus]